MSFVHKFNPITIVDPINPEQPGALVVTGEPAPSSPGVLAYLWAGYADNPLRVDPTGTTVQPVNVVSGGGINSSVAPTGSPVPSNATFVGGEDPGGNLHGLSTDSSGKLNVNASITPAPAAPELTFAVDTGQNFLTVTAQIPVLSLQPQSGTGTTTFIIESLDVTSDGSIGQYRIVRNATLTGASFSNVGSPSKMTFDTAATSSSGGQVVASGSFNLGSDGKPFTTLGFFFSGAVGDILTLLINGVSSNQVKVMAAFRWSET